MMFIRLVTVAFMALTIIIAHSFPWLKTPVIFSLCNGLAVLGVIVLIRAGQVSFGHAMYSCAAGYTVVFLARAYQLDGLLLIGLATMAATLFSTLLGLFIVRYRGIFFGMLNLAFSMVLYSIISKFTTVTGGTDGLSFSRPQFAGFVLERDAFETTLLYVALSSALICGFLAQRYFNSAPGQALAAIKTNETRLEYLGISAKHVFWMGYLFSGFLAGLGGSLFAIAQGLVTPEAGYWVRSGEFVFIAILGGSGHAIGAYLGAFIFEFVRFYAAALLTGAWQITLGVVLLVIIFLAPEGLVGMLTRFRLPARR
ncbi:MAG: branched-chain amino acid ABC transporter permease [Desulfobacterales bacterium]|jgi:ABC-type branched-subunit amino acid transport system permease subunit|nr:branched-chain amino acid ABC transporter permease [Desulfobacterales bacterium]